MSRPNLAEIVEVASQGHLKTIKDSYDKIVGFTKGTISLDQITKLITEDLVLMAALSSEDLVKKKRSEGFALTDIVHTMSGVLLEKVLLPVTYSKLFLEDKLVADYSRKNLYYLSNSVAELNVALNSSIPRYFEKDNSVLYVSGILHEIGLLAMEQYIPNEFEHMMRNRFEYKTVNQAQMDIIGFTHTSLATTLMEHWEFPKSYIEICDHDKYPNSKYAKINKLSNVLIEMWSDLGEINRSFVFEPLNFSKGETLIESYFDELKIEANVDDLIDTVKSAMHKKIINY